MSDGMWTWTCSACGRQFTRDSKADAQSAFNEHAVDAHNAKVVLSVESGEKWGAS